jgi:serine-type D-Ala-D-Ala carboxypeptidase (penicillin-binding protein 5/6)
MKHINFFIQSLLILITMATSSAWALAQQNTALTETKTALAASVPAAPAIPARAFILMDFHTGKILASQLPDERFEPASITKLMTAYVVFNELKAGNAKLGDLVTVSKNAWKTAGSRTFLEPTVPVKIEDLLQGLIIQSGNDAAVALAEHFAGTEPTFAQVMNKYAEKLGMTQSHFMNTTGLPHAEHYSSAHDLAILARTIIREFPEYYKWYSQREFTYNGITQQNRNRLLARDPSVDGMKTGFTDNAGYCLVTSAQRDGMRLISVVLGSRTPETRADESAALLNFGFRFYETKKLYQIGQSITQQRVWKGEQEQIQLGISQDVYVTLPRNLPANALQPQVTLKQTIVAPVKKGENMGTLSVKIDDSQTLELPIVSLSDNPAGSLWQRIKDEVLLKFE